MSLYLALTFARTCPVCMLLIEAASKVLTIILVNIIALHVYYQERDSSQISSVEILLVIQLAGMILYEIGQIFEDRSIKSPSPSPSPSSSISIILESYVNNPWNFLDALSVVLILIWAIFCVFLPNSDYTMPQDNADLTELGTTPDEYYFFGNHI